MAVDISPQDLENKALVQRHLADPAAGWSVGTYGAIAEFLRDPDEPLVIDAADALATTRGAIHVAPLPGVRPCAYEGLSRRRDAWTQSIALCLPKDSATMGARRTLTEIGPDTDAVRPEDREAVLFDIGVGAPQVDFCIRTADPVLLRILRREAGRPTLASENPAMTAILSAHPHRVARSQLGRIEVFQPIGVHDEATGAPEGPHTHVLPKLLATGRSHAPSAPVPRGWLVAAELYPGNPVTDVLGQAKPFNQAQHLAFQALLARYGDDTYLAAKTAVYKAVRDGRPPKSLAAAASPLGRRGVRIGLRQLSHGDTKAGRLAPWRKRFEAKRPTPDQADGH